MTKRSVILFGDETGLHYLKESLKDKQEINVSLVIFSYKRMIKKEAGNIAEALGCEALVHPPKNTDDYLLFLQKLEEVNADIGICFSYDLIIKKEILDMFRMGIFNLHGALLPKNRGANALNWVLINGESETGMTLHKMDEGIDSGPIVLQKKVKIEYEDTAVSLRDKLAQAAIILLDEFWDMYINSKITLLQQDEEMATYLKRRKENDGFFEWNWEAEKIYNLIRGLVKPWPGAWYIHDGKKYIIDEYLTIEQVKSLKTKYC